MKWRSGQIRRIPKVKSELIDNLNTLTPITAAAINKTHNIIVFEEKNELTFFEEISLFIRYILPS